MRLTTLGKVALGILTACPALYVGLMFAVPVHDTFHLDMPMLEMAFEALGLLGLLAFLINAGLLAYYIPWVMRGQRIAASDRTVWVVLLLFAGFATMPVLYLKYFIRQDPA